jgi:hypothetical protein
MMLYLLLAIPIALFPISLTILLWKAPPLKGRLQSLRVVYDKLSEEERKHVPYPEDYYPGRTMCIGLETWINQSI